MKNKTELLNPYGVGIRLAEEREKKKMSLLEVSKRTKIHPDILKRIEADAFDRLPGYTYAKSYVAIYARCLGLPAKDYVQMLDGMQEDEIELDQFRVEDLEFMPKKRQPPALTAQGFGMFVIVTVLVIALGLAAFSSLKLYQVWPALAGDANKQALHGMISETEPTQENSQTNPSNAGVLKAQPVDAQAVEQTETAAQVGEHKLQLKAEATATEDQRWVRIESVTTSGKTKIYEGLLPQGKVFPSTADPEWIADKFQITLRDASSVDIIFDSVNYGKYEQTGYQKFYIPAE